MSKVTDLKDHILFIKQKPSTHPLPQLDCAISYTICMVTHILQHYILLAHTHPIRNARAFTHTCYKLHSKYRQIEVTSLINYYTK